MQTFNPFLSIFKNDTQLSLVTRTDGCLVTVSVLPRQSLGTVQTIPFETGKSHLHWLQVKDCYIITL